MIALCDATSFYACAEKSLDPSIRQRPVLVFSNNDGCCVALCPIAKRLGFKKFIPMFQMKDDIRKYNAVVRSSNYELTLIYLAKCSRYLMNTQMNCMSTASMRGSCGLIIHCLMNNGYS